jgi:hypothetical protein
VNKLWIVVALAACEDPKVPRDAALDAAIDARPIKPGEDTFYVPIGAACNEMPRLLCDGGFGVCTDGICRPRCANAFPHCEPPSVEHFQLVDGSQICSCVPQ